MAEYNKIDDIKHFFTESPGGTASFGLLTLLSGIAYVYFEELLGGTGILIGGVFAIFTIALISLTSSAVSRLQIQQEYQANNAILEAFIEGHGLGDLISERELGNIESNSNEIWVFTRDLSNDIGIEEINNQGDNCVFKTVKKNLIAGKRCTYFIPDEPKKIGAIEEFKKIHEYNERQVRFCLIPTNEFHVVSEIAIYDNNEAVQWFPSKKMNYFIRLDDSHRMGIIGSGQLLLNKYLFDI